MTSIWTVFLTHSYIHSHVAHLLALKLYCIWLLNILLQSFCLRILLHTPFQASVWLVLKTRPEPADEEACNSSAGPNRWEAAWCAQVFPSRNLCKLEILQGLRRGGGPRAGSSPCGAHCGNGGASARVKVCKNGTAQTSNASRVKAVCICNNCRN